MFSFLFLMAAAIAAFSFLVWAPAVFLGERGRYRYRLCLIIALSVPFSVFAYSLDGYGGVFFVALIGSVFIAANTLT